MYLCNEIKLQRIALNLKNALKQLYILLMKNYFILHVFNSNQNDSNKLWYQMIHLCSITYVLIFKY